MTRWAGVLVSARQLAEVIADTEFVPKAMRGHPDKVCAAIMYGDELGIGPMQALAGIAIIDGHPQPTAELMRALVNRAGHQIGVHEMTGHKCRVSGLRAGRPESERVYVEWSWDMAKAAGLSGKQNWRAYPRAMLLARATSDLARILFPDVVKGMSYIAEDDSALTLGMGWQEQEDAPTAPELPRPQRKRRPRPSSLPSPGHHVATEDKPGPDGSVDVPLPEAGERGAPAPEVGRDLGLPAPDGPPGDRGRFDNPAALDADAERRPRQGNPDPHDGDYPPETTPDEPPADDGEPPPPKGMGERPFKALQASLATVLGRVDRDDRLAALSAIVGRPVASSRDLTRDEGYRALGFLDRVNIGAAGLVKRHGEWEAVAYDVPPEEPGDPTDPWVEPAPPADDDDRDPWRDLGGGG